MERIRFVRERERKHITGISRTQWWRLEKEGRAPKRRQLGLNSVAWLDFELYRYVQIRAEGKEWPAEAA